jgi:SAM-dependent methyltransferase
MTLTATDFFSRRAEDFDPTVEAAFYGRLKMRNSTFKLTRASRFAEIEEAFGKFFADRAANVHAVLDVGVSTGITTIELADFLRSRGSSVKITATDLFIDAHIVEPFRGLRVLADPTGWPLQYDLYGKAIRPWIRRLDYVTLAFVPLMLARLALRNRVRALIQQGESKPVRLVSTRLAERSDISFIEDNILIRSPDLARRFDLVRAANILNRNYFSDQDLRNAIENIRSYLRGPGVLFLVTRTNAAQVNAGTLFELGKDQTFKVLARVGAGSEIEKLVLANV